MQYSLSERNSIYPILTVNVPSVKWKNCVYRKCYNCCIFHLWCVRIGKGRMPKSDACTKTKNIKRAAWFHAVLAGESIRLNCVVYLQAGRWEGAPSFLR